MMCALWIAVVMAVEPHPSYDKLVTANGFAGAVVNGANVGGVVLDRFSDHIWQQERAGSPPVRDLLFDAYFGVRIPDFSGWVTEADRLDMEEGTNLVVVERAAGGLRLTETVFAPMGVDWPAVVQILRVENPTAGVIEVTVFGLANHHVGDETNERERILPASHGGLVEVGDGSGLVMHLVPLVPPAALGCNPQGVWQAVRDGESLAGCAESAGDDRVGALQWDIGGLNPGESVTVGFVHVFQSGADLALPVEVAELLDGASPESLLEDERANWAAWQAQTALPAGLSADEAAVTRQSLAWLRMGQVREPSSAYGQIPASLLAGSDGAFEHIWNITWVRDAALSIAALSAYGHHEEARAALDFFLQDRAGDYASYLDGQDYAVSVCRVYGNGDEWSDEDADGPNVEFDNFGLILWAAGRYVADSGDVDFVREHSARLFDGTAEVLLALIDPETGLIRADSSIWEEHWNGRQKRFTWTSARAVAGLRAAADLAEAVGDERAASYRAAADGVAAAIAAQLVTDGGVLVGSYEEHTRGEAALDAAAVAAFNLGILNPASDVGRATFAAWDAGLRVASGNGYRRNDDGDSYDVQEWVVVDLWIAEALQRAGREEEAAALDAWITGLAMQNHLVLPELLDPVSGDFRGPGPMLGFGAAAYLLRMHERPTIVPVEADEPGDSGSDAKNSRCGCGSAAPPVGGLFVAGLALTLARRRAVLTGQGRRPGVV